MKANITESLIVRLSSKSKRYEVRDQKLKGFFIRVETSGSKSYYAEYARGQKIWIGRVGEVNVDQARHEAKVILAGGKKHVQPGSVEDIKQEYRAPTLFYFLNNQYESWVEWNKKSGKKTMETLKNLFIPKFGHLKLTEITSSMLEEWRTKRLRSGIEKSTLNRNITALKSALSKAVEWGIISENPLASVKQYKVDDLGHVRYLLPAEEERILFAVKNNTTYLRPLVIVAMNTGIRKGDLLNLTWSRIDFENKVITVSGATTKGAKTYYVPMNTVVCDELKRWESIQKNDEQEHVFTYNNLKIAYVKKTFGTLLNKAQITNFRFHDLRHHFASKLVMSGVDLNTVRELLGHVEITMTLRYAHLAPGYKAAAVERLVGKNELP